MNIEEQLGMRIRFLRKQKNMSQEQLSFESDINKNYISDLENGTRNPSLKVIARLAKALNVTLEELFMGIDMLDF